MPGQSSLPVCRRKRWRRGDGAVAVEFALVLPLLVMLLFGTVTAGITYTHGIGMTNAVREGSRFAATTKYPAETGDWTTDVITRTRALQFDDPTLETRVCVELHELASDGTVTAHETTCDGGSAVVATATPAPFTVPSGTPADTCVVRVWAAREFSVDAILVRFIDKTMTRESVAMYERKPCVAPSATPSP